MKILVHSAAEEDLADAYSWYEHKSLGLGKDFLLCVEVALKQIERNPESFQIVHKKVRRALLKRFPYGVFYVASKKEILVIAVFHAKRNPKLWKKR